MRLPWPIERRLKRPGARPFTNAEIVEERCFRCGAERPTEQWQVCADGNRWRPICAPCDYELNALVLRWMRHPNADGLLEHYHADLLERATA